MIAVVDANCLIDKELPLGEISEGYITSSVERELRDRSTCDFYQLCGFKIRVRDPREDSIEEVVASVRGKQYNLSSADVDVVALTLELSDEQGMRWSGAGVSGGAEQVVCLTRDNGIKSALANLGLYTDPEFQARRYKLRCFGCFALYSEEELDFCRRCGYSTLTRVTVVGEGDSERVLLSADYRYRPRVLRDEKGRLLTSEDQREYRQYKERQRRKKQDRSIFYWGAV